MFCLLGASAEVCSNASGQEQATLKASNNTRMAMFPLLAQMRRVNHSTKYERLQGDGRGASPAPSLGIAPSYFIEGMLWNVPRELFGTSYQAICAAVMN